MARGVNASENSDGAVEWVNSSRIRITLLVWNTMAASRSGKRQTIILQIFNMICIAFQYTTEYGDKKAVLEIEKCPNIKIAYMD
jgi:hypothetical protein